MNAPPLVSVIVPTHNRAPMLSDTLVDLVRQDVTFVYEVIVVDDGSTDATQAVVARAAASGAPSVRYVGQPPSGPNAARNAGLKAATGALYVLIDDDVAIPGSWLREMVAGWERRPDLGCYAGRIHLELEARFPRTCGRDPLGETELDLGDEERVITKAFSANMGISREAFATVGEFDEDLPIYGEEEAWLRRLEAAGGGALYVPAAELWHRRSWNDLRIRTLVRNRFRRGRSRYVNAPYVGVDRPTVPTALVRAFAGIRHLVGRRCAIGALNSVFWTGYAVEALVHRVRGPNYRVAVARPGRRSAPPGP